MSEFHLNKPVAFVIPWYGESIHGGAETLCRGFCHAMRRHNLPVRALATCVKNSQANWNKNYHKPGRSVENGVEVWRFPAGPRDSTLYDEINRKIVNGYPLTDNEELLYFQESVRSPELEAHIKANAETTTHLFLPYCFGTTYYGLRMAGRNGALWPCLHREGYAALNPTALMFQTASRLIYNSPAEEEFARATYDLDGVPRLTLGYGMDLGADPGDAAEFRRKHDLERPFLLYLGRKTPEKNLPMLLRFFAQLSRDTPIDLVIAGPGHIEIPDITGQGAVHDLGTLSEADKRGAFAACLALAQPSLFESLGIVLLEAWIERRPTLVNARCDVTSELARAAGGGLMFANYFEFRETVLALLRDPELADGLGRQGRAYIETECQWDTKVRRLCEFLNQPVGASQTAATVLS